LHFFAQMPAVRPPTVANAPSPAPVTSPETCVRSSVRLLSCQQTPPTPQTLSPSSLLQATVQKPAVDVPPAAHRLLAQPLAIAADTVQLAYSDFGEVGTQTPLVQVDPVGQPPGQAASTQVRRAVSQTRPGSHASAADPQSGRQAPTARPFEVNAPRKLHDEPDGQLVAVASPHFGAQLLRAPSWMQTPAPPSHRANVAAVLHVCRQIGRPYSTAQ
jgi:hypothetical protein